MPKGSKKKVPSVSAELVREVAAAVLTAKSKPKRQRRRRRASNQAPELPQSGVVKNPGAAPVTVSGDDYLEDITLSSATEDGALLMTLPIHPPTWGGTHAASLLRSYERYRLVRLEVLVSTRASAVIGGGYIAGCSPDASRGLVGGRGAARQAKAAVKAMPGSVTSPLHKSVRVVMPPGNNPQVWRYTDAPGSLDLESYGNFYLVVDGPPNFVTGLNAATLSISLRWTMHLASPTTGANASGALVAMIPRAQKVTKSEGTKSVDPYHPKNAYWVKMAETFNFGSVIAISPPISIGFSAAEAALYSQESDRQVAQTKSATFCRLSWHSQRDQLRVLFYDTYENAESDPEPDLNSSKALTLSSDGVTTAVDTYFSEVASRWKSQLRGPPSSARLLVDARANRLEKQGEEQLRKLGEMQETVDRLAENLRELWHRYEGQSLGTLMDPVFIAPIPVAQLGAEGSSRRRPSVASQTSSFEQVDV